MRLFLQKIKEPQIIIILIILWKFVLELYYPFLNSDGPWILSHLFSFIRGDFHSSTFAHDFHGDIFKTHVQELLLFPFYYFLPTTTITFLFINYIFITLNVFLIFYTIKKSFNNSTINFLLPLAYLFSVYTYGFRSETYTLTFLLLILLVSKINIIVKTKYYSPIIAFLGSIASLIHPMGAILCSILIVLLLISKKQFLQQATTLLFLGLLFSYILTFGELASYINQYSNSYQSSDIHRWSPELFLKYLTFSIGFLPMIIISILVNPKRNIMIWIMALLIISYFGRSYYFSYIVLILLVMYMERSTNEKFNKYHNKKFAHPLSILFLCFAMFITHINPTIINIENTALGKNYRKVLKKVDLITKNIPDNCLIWVPPQFAMEVIDQSNSRMYFHFYKHMAGEKINLNINDVILFFSKSKMEDYLKRNILNPQNELQISNIISPFSGKLRIGSLYTKRNEDYGLWKVTHKSTSTSKNN